MNGTDDFKAADADAEARVNVKNIVRCCAAKVSQVGPESLHHKIVNRQRLINVAAVDDADDLRALLALADGLHL